MRQRQRETYTNIDKDRGRQADTETDTQTGMQYKHKQRDQPVRQTHKTKLAFKIVHLIFRFSLDLSRNPRHNACNKQYRVPSSDITSKSSYISNITLHEGTLLLHLQTKSRLTFTYVKFLKSRGSCSKTVSPFLFPIKIWSTGSQPSV